jgi:hypothetical protein
MKKLIILAALLSVFVTSAQTPSEDWATFKINKPLVCGPTKKMIGELINGEYKELPAWGGDGEKTRYSLLINQETGSWTLVQFDKDNTCVLGVGEKSKVMNFNKKPTM